MANTFVVSRVEQGTKQFQGMFKEMWGITGTITDIDAINDDVSVEVALTIPGLALGDMFLGWAINVSHADANSSLTVDGYVSAANTLTLKFTNIDATTDAWDADTWNNYTYKILMGRPAW